MERFNPASLDADGFGWWFAGLVDGEGSFQMTPASRKGNRAQSNGTPYSCRFHLSLRADDGAILTTCRERLGDIGYLYRRERPGVRPQVAWQVTTHDDCECLVAVFERFPLRTKKARDFDLWRLAVSEWAKIAAFRGGRGHGGQADYGVLGELRMLLRETREYAEVAL